VTYLDLSTASKDIAEDRATARGLQNTSFHSESLPNIATIALGPLDYIDCCGVLHNVLADDGGMGLMVYTPYGRTGVYQAQAMLRALGNC
jgi:hypothetical protein